MQERHQFRVVASAVMGHQGVGMEHRLKAGARGSVLVAQLSEMFQAAGDVTLVPTGKDCSDVREIFVERGAPDSGPLGDLRHRD
jgi:hypothetical protein